MVSITQYTLGYYHNIIWFESILLDGRLTLLGRPRGDAEGTHRTTSTGKGLADEDAQYLISFDPATRTVDDYTEIQVDTDYFPADTIFRMPTISIHPDTGMVYGVAMNDLTNAPFRKRRRGRAPTRPSSGWWSTNSTGTPASTPRRSGSR